MPVSSLVSAAQCVWFSREWRRQNRNAARTPLVAVTSWRTLIGSGLRQSSLWRPLDERGWLCASSVLRSVQYTLRTVCEKIVCQTVCNSTPTSSLQLWPRKNTHTQIFMCVYDLQIAPITQIIVGQRAILIFVRKYYAKLQRYCPVCSELLNGWLACY